jgi:hypothetical protein
MPTALDDVLVLPQRLPKETGGQTTLARSKGATGHALDDGDRSFGVRLKALDEEAFPIGANTVFEAGVWYLRFCGLLRGG